jgi:hypothetical protein
LITAVDVLFFSELREAQLQSGSRRFGVGYMSRLAAWLRYGLADGGYRSNLYAQGGRPVASFDRPCM